MSQRPRRSVGRVNYRELQSFGFTHRTNEEQWETLSDDEDIFHEDVSDVDELESESDQEDDGEVDRISTDWTGSDGTKWTPEVPQQPLPTWRCEARNYFDGPVGDAKPENGISKSAKDIFLLMFHGEVLTEIVKWTNAYGEWKANDWNEKNPTARARKVWTELSVVELQAFIGLVLLGGAEKARHVPWSDMWTKDVRFKSHPFSATMSQIRFYNLMATLRFDDTIERRKNRSHAQSACKDTNENKAMQIDKLEPIRKISDLIIQSFPKLYTPGAFVCVDEQLIKFRGHCPFRVYMKEKPGRYGMKVWALADTASRFVVNVQFYTGKKEKKREVDQGKRVVMDLVQPILGTERGVVADNFFSSYNLVKELLANKLSYCGTLRKSRLEVPKSLRNIRGVPENTSLFLFNTDKLVTLERRVTKKNRYFLLISSSHYSNKMAEIRNNDISEINEHYNSLKFGVDTVDEMIAYYSSQFPTRRWPMKAFIHLVEVAAINAYVIDCKNNVSLQKQERNRRTFLRDLGCELIHQHIANRASQIPNLHSHIQDSMRIMGITLPIVPVRRPREGNPSANPAKKGRCYQCLTQSRRKCVTCERFGCKEHSIRSYMCKECATREERESSDSDSV